MDNNFIYKNNKLYCEQVPIKTLAEKFGTPLYLMSSNSMQNQYDYFEKAFSKLNHLTCYAVKANFNLSVINLFARAGSGADVGSRGELFRALKAGIPSEKIVMSGVGKSHADIEHAIKSKILLLSTESLSELKYINQIAKKLNTVVDITVRVNPSVKALTHAHISTGGHIHKFGIDEVLLPEVFRLAKSLYNIKIVGLDVHIGSQLNSTAPYIKTIKKLLVIKKNFEDHGFNIKYLDLGGGFPVTYDPSKPKKDLKVFADTIIPLLQNCGAKIIFEPGRYFVANAGVLITQVLYLKENSSGKKFVIVDAGMSELIRPVLYDAYHHIISVNYSSKKIVADVVGPICESADFFAKDREMQTVREKDYLVVLSTGAYGGVMGSNYNGRLRPTEVLIDGKNFKVIRKRETLEQFIQNEI
ncbi:MAG: diaminopimelate decarboxylase [Patescibacteria group bacterium]